MGLKWFKGKFGGLIYEDGLILGWAYIWPDVYVSEKGWA